MSQGELIGRILIMSIGAMMIIGHDNYDLSLFWRVKEGQSGWGYVTIKSDTRSNNNCEGLLPKSCIH